MMEIVNNIKDFVSYYNALVKEIERITPLKKGIESVLKVIVIVFIMKIKK